MFLSHYALLLFHLPVTPKSRIVKYSYDELDRLEKEEIFDPGATVATRTIEYAYDEVGNRLSRVDSAEGTTIYTYDKNDRLETETTEGVETVYNYDNNGNTISRTTGTDTVNYEWDAENRLVGADTDGDGNNDVTNQYDADGVRVAQTVNGEETRFLIDTNRPYAQVLEEYTDGGIIKVSYVYGNDLISQERNGEQSFYQVDGLGSTRALSDESGLATDRYIYDAFGRVLTKIGDIENSYLYTGEQRDSNLGLDYLRARYLDINTGRFFSRDTFEGILQNPITFNKYIYGNANPVTYTDPSGEFSLTALNAAVGINNILNIVFIPQFVFAGLTISVIKYVWEPAFRARETALLAISYGAGDEAFDLYNRAGELIGVGANLIGINKAATDFAQSVVSLANAMKSLAESTGNVTTIARATDLFLKAQEVPGKFQSLIDAIKNKRNPPDTLTEIIKQIGDLIIGILAS